MVTEQVDDTAQTFYFKNWELFFFFMFAQICLFTELYDYVILSVRCTSATHTFMHLRYNYNITLELALNEQRLT